jgi:hypothetical protein
VSLLTLQADFIRISKVQYKFQITCAIFCDGFETILINVAHILLFKVLAEMLLVLHQKYGSGFSNFRSRCSHTVGRCRPYDLDKTIQMLSQNFILKFKQKKKVEKAISPSFNIYSPCFSIITIQYNHSNEVILTITLSPILKVNERLTWCI